MPRRPKPATPSLFLDLATAPVTPNPGLRPRPDDTVKPGRPVKGDGMTASVVTSYYGGLKKLTPDLTPVCISRGRPDWFTGRVFLPLAPTWPMLKMSRAEYERAFEAILARLDPAQVLKELGPGAVLLCWERPGEACHRRRVAEWIEDALQITVPEFGIARETTPAFRLSPWKTKAARH